MSNLALCTGKSCLSFVIRKKTFKTKLLILSLTYILCSTFSNSANKKYTQEVGQSSGNYFVPPFPTFSSHQQIPSVLYTKYSSKTNSSVFSSSSAFSKVAPLSSTFNPLLFYRFLTF